MNAWIQRALGKLVSFLSIVWGLRNDALWRRAAWWSTGQWFTNSVVFIFALKHFGNPYVALGVQAVYTEAQSYAINKWLIFGHRQVSVPSSSRLTVPVALFCFLYHKGTAFLLVAVFGLGAYPARAILTGIGVMENPIRFLYNRKFPFAEKTETT
jgi:hypothetical protein